MKAAVRSKYGPPEVLSIKEVEIPAPKDNEVLIKVYATTVNRSDYHVLTGIPLVMRVLTGLFKPKLSITGSDFSGQIISMGKNVKLFKAGDNVMGFVDMGAKSHAQYLTITENKIIPTPENVTYEQAVACLEGAFYALSSINSVKPKPGQKALVIGATGAIGSSYVQFFKFYEVYVTAVCGGENRQLVRSLGADKVIDYKTEDFTDDDEQYDFVFDAVGKSSFAKCKHLLTEKGIFTSSGGFENIFLAFLTPLTGEKKVIFPIQKNLIESLRFIKALVEKGKFTPLIDRKYPLAKIVEAYNYVGSGQKIGNVIISPDLS